MQRRAEKASWRQAAGVRPVIWATSAKRYPKTSCRINATRSAGIIESSTTRNAMLTDSSRVTRSAGSAVVPPGCPLIHSAGSGSGSGIHWPT